MKTISFLITADRGLELLRYFEKHYPNICNITLSGENITFEFNDFFTDLIVQGIFHAGISIGLQVNLIQKL